MSLDVIIRRKILFVGCILIIPAIELSKISRSLFMALYTTLTKMSWTEISSVLIPGPNSGL